jgi:molybdate transport system substrate-binding protein
MMPLGRNKGSVLLGLALVALAGCAKEETETPSAQTTTPPPTGKKEPLLCYVGGTMRPVMKKLVELYEARSGQQVQLDYGDSGGLLIKLGMTGKGDLYVCHDPFLDSLTEKGLGRQGWHVATITPAIAVPKGNPKGINGMADLARPGLRVGLTHPKYSTLGHINPYMFKKLGEKTAQALLANVKTQKRSGGETANDVSLGHLDAAIVWNAVIQIRRDKLDRVDIETKYHPDPSVDVVTSATPIFNKIDLSGIRVTIATLKSSKQPEAAREFAEFVNSPRGRAVFVEFGFTAAPASAPTPRIAAGPPLYLYCGAGIRPAVDEAVRAFTAKTGIQVTTDYGGSGMLLGRLKLTKKGDLYMPGDVHYVELAKEAGLIDSHKGICYFVPVILVAKGNPLGIKTLADLVRDGVKLGLGNPRSCAIGRLTKPLFERNGIAHEKVRARLAMTTHTVNELGLQVKLGALDAAVVWDAMANYYADSTDTVAIPVSQNIISHVAIGVLKTTSQAARAQAFVDFLAGPEGRDIFGKRHYTVDTPK